MGFFFGAFAIGFLPGFLSWKVVKRQLESNANPYTFNDIAALLGLLLSSTILVVFKPGSSAFAGYALGAATGFLLSPGWNFFKEQRAASIELSKKEYDEEIELINSNWTRIDSTITNKLRLRMNQDELGITEAILLINELNELGYSAEGKLAIMRGYAQNHIGQGVELRSYKLDEGDEEEAEEVHYLYQALTKPTVSGPTIGIILPATINTTYLQGNDGYQSMVAIVSPSGEKLGECGVGIQEAIGGGSSKKVSAFWIRLADINNDQKTYLYLMSSNAFANDAIRKRFVGKGILVRAKTGGQMVLETKAIKVIARVVDLSYEADNKMDKESFFKQIKIELDIRTKVASISKVADNL
jgi:hypothetical protein